MDYKEKKSREKGANSRRKPQNDMGGEGFKMKGGGGTGQRKIVRKPRLEKEGKSKEDENPRHLRLEKVEQMETSQTATLMVGGKKRGEQEGRIRAYGTDYPNTCLRREE